MSVRDLIPRRRGHYQTPAMFRDDERNPFLSLHREMNRLFDDAFRGFDTRLPAFASERGGWPSLEIAETEQELKVCAEIPGMDEKDVEILLDEGILTLRGEKRSEIEDKEKQFSERYYGHFERRIPLGTDVQADRAEAKFKNGVLTVTIPKNPNPNPRVKRIAIKS